MNRAIISYAVLTVTVLIFTLGIPANMLALHAYGLTDYAFRIIYFLVDLPVLIIMFSGFYAYAKMFQYAASIDDHAEQVFFRQIAIGLAWLAWSIPIWLMVPAISREFLNSHQESIPTYRMIINYANIVSPLIGFSLIGYALRFHLDEFKLSYRPKVTRGILVSFFIGAAIYCYVIFKQIGSTNLASSHNVYNLPLWLIVLTIIIPLLYTWLVGLLVGDELNKLSKNIEGVLYRRYLKFISFGLTLVFGGMIAFQLSSTLVFNPGYFKLDKGLVMLEFLAIIRCAGFVLIAIGAAKLKKFEET